MSKLDDVLNEAVKPKLKRDIKNLFLELVSETDFAYKDASAYAQVIRKKIEAL